MFQNLENSFDPNRELFRILVDPTIEKWVKRVIVRWLDFHPEFVYEELREELEINGEYYRSKYNESED